MNAPLPRVPPDFPPLEKYVVRKKALLAERDAHEARAKAVFDSMMVRAQTTYYEAEATAWREVREAWERQCAAAGGA